MTRLLLVRHGQSEGNVRQILQGQDMGALTELGRQQAAQLSQRLATEHIDAFIASDLTRALDTCRIIAQPHHLPVVTTPLLRERDWGDFTGESIPDLKDKPWPENVETITHLKQRAADFLSMVSAQYAGQTVLAVGHGIINKAVQAVYYHKPMHEVEKMTNVEVRELRL